MLSTITRIAKPATSPKAPPADQPPALPQEVKALAVVLREEFEAPFRFYDAATGSPIAVPGQEDAATMAARGGARGGPRDGRGGAAQGDARCRAGGYLIGFPLAGFGPSSVVAIGVVPGLARTPAESVQERARLEKWSRSVHDRLVGAQGDRDRQRSQAEQDRQSMVAWEAMMALERLHRGAKIHKDSARERQRRPPRRRRAGRGAVDGLGAGPAG